jgi:hypothetical protein
MNEELTQKLFNRFSFFSPQKSPRRSLMGFGFECGDGWFDIIWELCEDIERELNLFNVSQRAKEELSGQRFEVIQVKEKFGTLRFYTNYTTENIETLIQKAEEKSAKTCEICGEPGTQRYDGWVQTLCDTHAEE